MSAGEERPTSVGTADAIAREQHRQFMKRGYGVIFMSREGSAAPFARRLQELVSPNVDLKLMDKLVLGDTRKVEITTEEMVSGTLEVDERLVETLTAYKDAIDDQCLLPISFVTVEEYLWTLRVVARHLGAMKRFGMLFLAAAVSDFHVPRERLRTHKIESGPGHQAGGITLQLDDVPKCLGMIRAEWAPESFRVSFKLETNRARLMPKARRSLERYGMHVVVANELQSRYDRVELVFPGGEERTLIKRRGAARVIEEQLVEAVARKHFEYIADGANHAGLEPDGNQDDASLSMDSRDRRKRALVQWTRVATGLVVTVAAVWFSRKLKEVLVDMVKSVLADEGGDGGASGVTPEVSPVPRLK